MDIKFDNFWKCNHYLLHSVFHSLLVLGYTDSNTPAMDTLYYLSRRFTKALELSKEKLNDEISFMGLEDDGGLDFEIEHVFDTTMEQEASDEENYV